MLSWSFQDILNPEMQNKLPIIFENENLIVINKPSGLTVNRSETTKGNTVQDLIEDEYDFDKYEEPEFLDRSGIVHRLDKETSGCLIIAKNSKSFRSLQDQFKRRIVRKEYIALVHGQLKPEQSEINVPVGRLPWNRKRFGVVAGGREAVTKYKVESFYDFENEILSYVRLFPTTGRTHQIRVHMKYINHPIFSDELYGGRKTAREDRRTLPRVFLHAEKISFHDPANDDKINCVAPLPTELTSLLEKLKPFSIIN